MKVLRNETQLSLLAGVSAELRNFSRTEPLLAFGFSQ